MAHPGQQMTLRSLRMLVSSALGLPALPIGLTYFTSETSARGPNGVVVFGYVIGAALQPAGASPMIRTSDKTGRFS
jgi:hypothetical protein